LKPDTLRGVFLFSVAKNFQEGYRYPLIFEPGNGWAYGPGMDWAGRVVLKAPSLPLPIPSLPPYYYPKKFPSKV